MAPASNPPGYEAYRALQLRNEGGLMTLTLSNPGKRNAVSDAMSEELTTVWEDLWRDPAVRVVVLTGEGSDFCSGRDVSSLAGRPATPPGRPLHPSSRAAKKHVMGILECEKPVIAKVRGVAYGMGVNMALACDMVFAARGARLCDSHVKAGMVAGDGGVLLWPLLCGMHRSKEYLMTGEPVPAEEAERIGLINRCLPDDELDAHVEAMARKLMALPPHAVNYTKVSLNAALKQMTGAAFEASVGYELYSMGMNDFRAAAAALAQRRTAQYEGN